jgi:hypothetical protein
MIGESYLWQLSSSAKRCQHIDDYGRVVGNPSVTRPNGQQWGKMRVAVSRPERRVLQNLGERIGD